MSIDFVRHFEERRKLELDQPPDPQVEALVTEVIARVANKWTMIVIEALAEHGELRFSALKRLVTGISQKMLTQTLRDMEREGLVTRTVIPTVPPRVDYRLTELGLGLGAAFCGVWIWAGQNLDAIEQSRARFDADAALHRSKSGAKTAGPPGRRGLDPPSAQDCND
jgi:DNA-binding HxlR family transcriptional regulator